MDCGLTTITEYACEADVSVTSCSQDSTTDPCRNPFYALDHQDTCPAISIASLRLEPPALTITKGKRGYLRVVAVFSTGEEGEVTADSRIETGDDGIAAYVSAGVVTGSSEGATWVEATWRGYAVRGTVTVIDNPCVEETGPWDVVFVLDPTFATELLVDRPPVRFKTDPISGNRYEGVRHYYWKREVVDELVPDFYGVVDMAQLSLSLVNPYDSDPGKDRFALVVTDVAGPRIEWTWSNQYRGVIGTSLRGLEADARLGRAVDLARVLFTEARPEARKLCVVITAGTEWSCNPSLRSAADAIKSNGVDLAIVSRASANTSWISTCSYPQNVFSYLQACASPCLLFGGTLYAQMSNVLGGVTAEACGGPCASGA